MTRVLHVSDLYPPQRGGLEAHVARLGAALSARGHDVAVATVADSDRDGAVPVFGLGLELTRVPGLYHDAARPPHPPWADRRFTAGLGRLVEQYRPDVLHAHGWCMFSAAAAARRHQVPLVVTLHDHGLACPARTLACGTSARRLTDCIRCHATNQRPVRRCVLAAALRVGLRTEPTWRVLAVSHSAARTGATALPTARIEVIPNFIDLVDSRPCPTPAEGPVLFVGPTDPPKGRAVLEAAHARLAAAGVPIPLTLVGDAVGQPQDQRLVTRPGRLTGEALWDAYRAAALVVVCPTAPDACPTVALEAMAFGRPLVASALGGLLDIVRPGATGVLVAPDDPRALAHTITGLLARPQLRVQMGEAARRRATRFSAAAVVPRIEAVYDEVAGAGAARTELAMR